jgi:hypothetical protein
MARDYLLSQHLGQHPLKCIPGTVFPGVQQKKHAADHSPPSSAEVKNEIKICTTGLS